MKSIIHRTCATVTVASVLFTCWPTTASCQENPADNPQAGLAEQAAQDITPPPQPLTFAHVQALKSKARADYWDCWRKVQAQKLKLKKTRASLPGMIEDYENSQVTVDNCLSKLDSLPFATSPYDVVVVGDVEYSREAFEDAVEEKIDRLIGLKKAISSQKKTAASHEAAAAKLEKMLRESKRRLTNLILEIDNLISRREILKLGLELHEVIDELRDQDEAPLVGARDGLWIENEVLAEQLGIYGLDGIPLDQVRRGDDRGGSFSTSQRTRLEASGIQSAPAPDPTPVSQGPAAQ